MACNLLPETNDAAVRGFRAFGRYRRRMANRLDRQDFCAIDRRDEKAMKSGFDPRVLCDKPRS